MAIQTTLMRYKVFDMEVYNGWWCLVKSNPDYTDVEVITSDDKDYRQRINNMIIGVCYFGFNVKWYDLIILNAIKDGVEPKRLYELSQNIVNEREDVLNNIKYWSKFNFSDLMDDWRDGGLKAYEANKGMSIVECDVPFETENLTEAQKLSIIKYCKYDVKATCTLLKDRETYINSKLLLGEMFNIRADVALKSSLAKLASLILGAKKTKFYDEPVFKFPNDRVETYVRNCLPEYVVNMFHELNENEKVALLFDNEVVFGKGGIHSVIEPKSVSRSCKDYVLLNIDVTSYYPMLLIVFDYMSRTVKNRDIYPQIFTLRRDLKGEAKKSYKNGGVTEEYLKLDERQTALKLFLNIVYGAMRQKTNALYDDYNGISLCYLGQLLLASLANQLYSTGYVKIIQTNTDGILVKVLRSFVPELKKIVSNWENLTNFSMEYEEIDVFFQRDVNNYIEVQADGRVKLKGKWANQAEESLNTLNAPVTHKAILNYYTKGIPIEETVYSNNNPIDFCFTAKRGKKYLSTIYTIGDETFEVNKVNRVMATTDKKYGTLKKFKIVEEEIKIKTEKGKMVGTGDYKLTDRYDKVAEIPMNCKLVNDEVKFVEDLDREWYVEFAKNKIKELVAV